MSITQRLAAIHLPEQSKRSQKREIRQHLQLFLVRLDLVLMSVMLELMQGLAGGNGVLGMRNISGSGIGTLGINIKDLHLSDAVVLSLISDMQRPGLP